MQNLIVNLTQRKLLLLSKNKGIHYQRLITLLEHWLINTRKRIFNFKKK